MLNSDIPGFILPNIPNLFHGIAPVPMYLGAKTQTPLCAHLLTLSSATDCYLLMSVFVGGVCLFVFLFVCWGVVFCFLFCFFCAILRYISIYITIANFLFSGNSLWELTFK